MPENSYGVDNVTWDWAASGVAALTGQPAGPPLLPPGHAASYARQLSARIAELTAGTPSPVAIDGAALLAERAAFKPCSRRGQVSPGGACRLLRTSDGWAAVSCARPGDVRLIAALIECELWDDPWPPLVAWLRTHSGAELAHRASLLGLAAGPIERPTHRPVFEPSGQVNPRDVSGALVVDFSALWAGPLCAHLLGLAGAKVVKVETVSRPDGARRGSAAFYDLLHGGHRSIVVDPRHASDREVLSHLVDRADIVIEASRPRALAGFGLDAHGAVAAGKTWISITAAGRLDCLIGFGDDVAARAGLVAYDEVAGPMFVGDAIADPLAGLYAATLALTAPEPPSEGRLHDISMIEVIAGTLDPTPPLGQPSQVARLQRDGWVFDTEAGPVPIAQPRGRTPGGSAARPGQHTTEVLSALKAGREIR